jgi:two-component system, response regulator, stage 0 sporulation protein A
METNPEIRILLVEDEPALRDLIALVLSQQPGYQVATAANGLEALAAFQEQPPSVLILDILLPQMNGLQLLVKLKEKELLGEAVIIIISGLGYGEIVQQAVAAGARYFLVKPVDMDLLVERIKQAQAEAHSGSIRSLSAD